MPPRGRNKKGGASATMSHCERNSMPASVCPWLPDSVPVISRRNIVFSEPVTARYSHAGTQKKTRICVGNTRRGKAETPAHPPLSPPPLSAVPVCANNHQSREPPDKTKYLSPHYSLPRAIKRRIIATPGQNKTKHKHSRRVQQR